MFVVLGAVAELERSLIRERVNAGLAKARRKGKVLGRPRVIVDREKVARLKQEGYSVRAIAPRLSLESPPSRQSYPHNFELDFDFME